MTKPGKFKKGKHVYTKWGHNVKEVKTMPASEPKKEGAQLQIELDEETAQGAYINLASISHSETEFVVDFIFAQPQQSKAKVRARIISSPLHIKRFLHALESNINRYENRFGEIKQNTAKGQPVKYGNA